MHWTVILAIIIFAALLILMMVFIRPLPGQGAAAFNETEFRIYCAWWAQTDYKGTSATVKNEPDKNMTDLCTQELGLPTPLDSNNANDPNWDRCRARCKVAYPKV